MGTAFAAFVAFVAGSNFGLSLDSVCSSALATPKRVQRDGYHTWLIAMVDNCIAFWDRFGTEISVYGQSLCVELVK